MWHITLVASTALLFNCQANSIKPQNAIPKQASNLSTMAELIEAAMEFVPKSSRSISIGKDEESRRQLDAFAAKSTKLQQSMDSASRSIVVIQNNKKRHRNLKILNNDGYDMAMVGDIERIANIADTFSACLEWIQSIPGKINCFIFGNCEESNEDEGEEEEESGSDEKDDNEEAVGVEPGAVE